MSKQSEQSKKKQHTTYKQTADSKLVDEQHYMTI